ncbi:nucleotidyl transferase AbiEii/AbiGii toxin family protein [Cellulomonas triticagri]|uniref:Nucleotidyl transferase AbiEii/AbiGii toxin family protein n=1 Tax=Cellulomonas triticagri TaxID=2483352 RepID=A0A3M2J3N0_9CELL|nr:nucleotidyl transferase AbiEii/AbiGii toxin family protein [Cellulomonas triticagri]RMI06681.1 nucleotidyl transferase AbiEii/AbiGii toxin family protein [Cellulomonas triticagri]
MTAGAPYGEWEAVAERFDVDQEQVRRDHLISHVLGAIAAVVPSEDLVFFGGTALSRTFLADARLSEDIDLIALAPRAQVAEQIESAVRRGLARSHGRPVWRPALTATAGSEAAVLEIPGAASVQVQLLAGAGYLWPTEVRDVEQRYGDAPPARLRTLTAPGFAAAKLGTWIDRRAPRDLYDLWALGRRGLLDEAALDVFVRFGPTARPPSPWVFDHVPDESQWRRALAHQTRLDVSAAEALDAVRAAWLRLSEA